jgi:hypothetical protein
MLSMSPNLSSHIVEMMRAETQRAQPHPRPERRARRRLTLRWRRRADRRARRVAPA